VCVHVTIIDYLPYSLLNIVRVVQGLQDLAELCTREITAHVEKIISRGPTFYHNGVAQLFVELRKNIVIVRYATEYRCMQNAT
jgi:hypothetical protein